MDIRDIAVILVYFVGMIVYGLWVSRKHIKSSDSYFRGNRKFKWWTMMGQAFGTGTSAEMPVAQAGASFQGGFSTIWYQWKNLIITPFYWLIAPWYRRSQRTTIGELVRDRFGKEAGLLYTVFALFFFIFVMGAMLQGAAKVISEATGELISTNAVVIWMTAAFIIYSYFGGLIAAAKTEVIQGVFIIILSFMLIPYGLLEIGGFGEMRDILPSDFFKLYSEKSGLDAFTIAMLAVNGVIGITAQPHMMSVFATSNNEKVGRVGQTYGTFVKRFVTIGWTLTGVIVAAIVIQKGITLDDPEDAFGYATRLLLSPGLVGLMIAALMAANMSSCSNYMVNLGALFTKELYQPYINKSASDRQVLLTGRIAGFILTIMGTIFALSIVNVLWAFLFTETIAAFMGIMIVGGILWKGANRYGGISSVLVSYISYYILNYIDAGRLELVYPWKPEPFGWAMLIGFITLVVVSKLTPKEPKEKIDQFFQKMETHSDHEEGEPEIVDKELILLDVGTWFQKSRWKKFFQRYKTDFWGFVLAWGFVAFLIFIAWLVLQIKK